jgi:hypothetical protein
MLLTNAEVPKITIYNYKEDNGSEGSQIAFMPSKTLAGDRRDKFIGVLLCLCNID